MNAHAKFLFPAAPALTPARQKLSEQIDAVAHARSELDRAGRPVERLREQLSVASQQLEAAEIALAEIDARHAAGIKEQAKEEGGEVITLTKPPGSAKAEAAIENARRTCNAVRAALAECEREQNDRQADLGAATAELDALVLAVIVEEHQHALEKRRSALEAFLVADASAKSLTEIFGRIGRAPGLRVEDHKIAWLQAARAARQRLSAEPIGEITPDDIEIALRRWRDVVGRLQTDATAQVGE
jgi:hypothetical protein